MTWFWFALASAISLALADSFTKKYFSAYTGLSILLVRLSLPGLVLLPYTIYSGLPDVPVDFWYFIAILVPLEIIAMWFYVRSIRDAPLHLTLPYLAFTPVFIIVTGYIFLGETVSWDGAAGIVLIVLGAYILNIERVEYKWQNLFAPLTAIVKIRGSLLMLCAAVIYSFTSVLSKKALLYTDASTFGALYYSLIGVSTLVIVLILQPGVVVKMWLRPGASLLIGALMAAMVVCHFMAIERIEVAYMISVKRTSMIFGILLGAWMFKDMNFRQHLPASLMMFIGVVLILI
jgi:drug/metabolite transporter (DMT)-like permease